MGIIDVVNAGSDMVVTVSTAESLASMGSDKSNANVLSNSGQLLATAASFNPITTIAITPSALVLTTGKN